MILLFSYDNDVDRFRFAGLVDLSVYPFAEDQETGVCYPLRYSDSDHLLDLCRDIGTLGHPDRNMGGTGSLLAGDDNDDRRFPGIAGGIIVQA